MTSRALQIRDYPYYLANRPVYAERKIDVVDKYSGEVFARVSRAEPDVIDEGIRRASETTRAMARMPPYARQEVLEHCVARFRDRREELAGLLCLEAGKPIGDADSSAMTAQS